MAALKDALIQLSQIVELQYVSLEDRGDELEALEAEFEAVCDCTCSEYFDIHIAHVVPNPLPPSGTVTFETLEVTSNSLSIRFGYGVFIDETSFYYSLDNRVVIDETGFYYSLDNEVFIDVTGFYYSLDNGASISATSPLIITGLTPSTPHTIRVAPHNAEATGTWTTYSFTTAGAGGGGGDGFVFGTPTIGNTTISQPFTYGGTGATSFTAKLDGVSIGTVVSPIELDELTEDTEYEITVAPVTSYGVGSPVSVNVRTTDVEPTGTITFGTPTITITTITQPFTYAYGDATSFTAEVNGSSIGTVTSPISLSGLAEGTEYEIIVTPINAHGAGIAQTVVRTTAVASVAPTGEVVFGASTSITSTSFVVNFTYTGTDATSFLALVEELASVDGVLVEPYELTGVVIMNNVPVTSPFLVSGLTPSSFYATSVTPVNSLGSGTTASLG